MNSSKCPQCENSINESTNRLIQDACGHKKCRICLLKDEAKCETCRIENLSSNIVKSNANKSYAEPKVIEKAENIKSNSSILKSFSAIDHVVVISRVPLLFKCTVCSKTFSTYTNKKYHAYCRGIEKPLKCNYCDKRFISQSHLETHVLKHSGIRPFACSICKASFIQRSKLNRHMKIHTGDRPFVCSECGKRFSNKDALTGHHRIHSGDKPYTCKKCDSKFNNKSNLSKHLSTHAKDKLFMCEECSKKFVNKWSLVAHRKCHSQERPHTCQHCKKAFTTIKDLRRHEVIHLDIKPYECNICKTKFCRKDNLERHLKNTHCINGVSEIKSASTKIIISRKQECEHTNINEADVSKCNLSIKPSSNGDVFVENPNAITVIKTCSLTQENSMANAVSVINGPFKLAFKTDAFKNNYNIFKKDYKESAPRIQTKKPYDMVESLNICQKILSPMHITTQRNETADNSKAVIDSKSKNVIMSVGKVNEKDSLEICKKILTSMEVPPLHYETSFEEKKHALIKNIKFKLPSTYTNITGKLAENSMDNIAGNAMIESSEITEAMSNLKEMINVNDGIKSSFPELINFQGPKLKCSEENPHSCDSMNTPCTLSVIVNPQTCDVSQKMHEKYWRKVPKNII